MCGRLQVINNAEIHVHRIRLCFLLLLWAGITCQSLLSLYVTACAAVHGEQNKTNNSKERRKKGEICSRFSWYEKNMVAHVLHAQLVNKWEFIWWGGGGGGEFWCFVPVFLSSFLLFYFLNYTPDIVHCHEIEVIETFLLQNVLSGFWSQ